jgi:two-component system, LytTR family, response regulator
MKIINDKAIIPVFSGFKTIELESICFFKATNKKTELFLVDGKSICLNMALKDVISILPKQFFFHCHRSYIVNILHIIEYNKISTENLIQIYVSTRKAKYLLNKLKQLDEK